MRLRARRPTEARALIGRTLCVGGFLRHAEGKTRIGPRGNGVTGSPEWMIAISAIGR